MNNRPKFAIFVFSYNRGKHLETCIRSIATCAPECFVYIVDDSSDDPETLKILGSLPENVSMVNLNAEGNIKHGGLYNNMNSALGICKDCDIAMFLQDDMQFVRSFGHNEISEWMQLLNNSGRPTILYPAFLKESTTTDLDLELSETAQYYVSKNQKITTGRFYSDIFIASPKKLNKIGWKFENGELETSLRAASEFREMRYLVNPVLAYTPYPKSYRKRKVSPPILFIEKIYGFGQYEFEVMTGDSLHAFLSRDPKTLPIAESHLQVKGTRLKTPWRYSAFEATSLAYPLYNFFDNPIGYSKYQISKILAKLHI